MAKTLPLVVLGIILVLRLCFGQSVRETFLLRGSLRKLIENELRNSDVSASLRDKYVRTLHQLSAFPLTRNYTAVGETSEEISAQPRLTSTRPTAALSLSVGCSHKGKVSTTQNSFISITPISLCPPEDLLFQHLKNDIRC